MRAVLITACLAFGLLACTEPAPPLVPPPPTKEELAAQEARAVEMRVKAEEARIASIVARSDELAAQLNALHRDQITGVEQGIEAIKLFRTAALFLRRANEADTAKLNAAHSRLSALLVKKQVQIFPSIRQAYARHMERELGYVAVYVRAGGTGNKTLRIASPTFSSQETVLQSYHSMNIDLTRFRFSKAEFVYSIDGRYWSMKVHGDPDSRVEFGESGPRDSGRDDR